MYWILCRWIGYKLYTIYVVFRKKSVRDNFWSIPTLLLYLPRKYIFYDQNPHIINPLKNLNLKIKVSLFKVVVVIQIFFCQNNVSFYLHSSVWKNPIRISRSICTISKRIWILRDLLGIRFLCKCNLWDHVALFILYVLHT